MRLGPRIALALLLLGSTVATAASVVRTEPANGAKDVSPATQAVSISSALAMPSSRHRNASLTRARTVRSTENVEPAQSTSPLACSSRTIRPTSSERAWPG